VVVFCRDAAPAREPIPAEDNGHTSGRVHVHADGAMLPHELGMQTATRATASDGVNDPVRAPWGQVPGTAAGSFTPSFLQ
jgi:hypothetical protein